MIGCEGCTKLVAEGHTLDELEGDFADDLIALSQVRIDSDFAVAMGFI